ncbi:MAG: ester cyclase [Acidimicrobiales bacterium]
MSTTVTSSDVVDTRSDVVRRYVDAFNRRDVDVIEAVIHPEFVDRHLPAEIPAGPEGVALWWQILSAAFTMEVEVEDMVEASDRVATRCTLRAPHIGEFAGIPATGRHLEISMMSIERFAGDRIVERWEVYDGLTMLAQLGVQPPA